MMVIRVKETERHKHYRHLELSTKLKNICYGSQSTANPISTVAMVRSEIPVKCSALLAVLVVIPTHIPQPKPTSRIIITVKPAMVAMVTISMLALFR